MASSIILGKGSDFYDEYSTSCQSCFVQGKGDIPANSFCVDCQEYLCSNCSACHNALKATKNHILVTAEEAKKNTPPKATKDKCSLKCTVHHDKTVKYFCVSHAYLGCSVCITMNHKQCTDVDYIPTVAEDIRNHDDFKKFDEKLKALDTAYKTGISDVEKNLKTIEADERQMKAAIKQFRKQMNDAVDKYEKELISKAMAVKSEETKKLNVLSKYLATSLANVDTLAGKVANLLSRGKSCDTYVLMKKEADQLISLEKELIKAVKGATCQRYEFQPNKDVLKADILGTLEIRSETVSFSAAVTAVVPVYKDGPTMAKLLKTGTRVRRGKDWNRKNEDGGELGTVILERTLYYGLVNNRNKYCYAPGWYRVQWDCGFTSHYRMGADGAYDLEIV